VEQGKETKLLSNTIIKADRPIKDIQFSNSEDIYNFTVEELETNVIDSEEPEPEFIKFTPESFDDEIKQAYQRGFQDGITEHEQKIDQEFQQKLGLLERITKDVVLLKNDMLKLGEEIVVRLAINIAQKVIKTEVQLHPDIIINVVKDALTKISSIEKEITIHINPQDEEILNQHREFFGTQIQEIEIKTDNRISRGGCFIETNYSAVDATLDTQMDEIDRVLLKECENA